MKKNLVATILLLFFCIFAHAQVLSVKSFEASHDLIPRVDERYDANKRACALIKVQIALTDVVFEGPMVGEPVYRTGEYWVYISEGSSVLRIKHPRFQPIEVPIPSGTLKKVESNRVYILTVAIQASVSGPKVINNTADGNSLILRVKPKNAKVTVDGVPVNINNKGLGTVFLTQGEHFYVATADSCETYWDYVSIGTMPVNKEIKLDYLKTYLTIRTNLDKAKILVNGEDYNYVNTKHEIVPGKYDIRVSKDGYRSRLETVNVIFGESRNVVINNLAPLLGGISVSTYPQGAKVSIDGKYVGITPKMVDKIPAGQHVVEISKEGYQPIEKTITVKEGENCRVLQQLVESTNH